jgi:hypothetical protein
VRTTGVHNLDDTVKEVVLGVDTHLNVHVAVVVDGLGRLLGESKIPTRPSRATENSFVGRRISEF